MTPMMVRSTPRLVCVFSPPVARSLPPRCARSVRPSRGFADNDHGSSFNTLINFPVLRGNPPSPESTRHLVRRHRAHDHAAPLQPVEHLTAIANLDEGTKLAQLGTNSSFQLLEFLCSKNASPRRVIAFVLRMCPASPNAASATPACATAFTLNGCWQDPLQQIDALLSARYASMYPIRSQPDQTIVFENVRSTPQHSVSSPTQSTPADHREIRCTPRPHANHMRRQALDE